MLYIFLSDKKVHHSEHLYKKKRILNIIKAISNYRGMLKDYCNEKKGINPFSSANLTYTLYNVPFIVIAIGGYYERKMLFVMLFAM